jgi:hypothetical protein
MREKLHDKGDPLDEALAAMANDPDTQRELRLIEAEFAMTELDGLEEFE